MVKKLQKSKGTRKPASVKLSGTVKDSAQQIWQAGLGAFTRAQAEGGKAFEALVKEGVSIQRKTQAAAEEKINEATSKMSTMANDITSKATGQWDKLENIFEERVAKALNKLGVPSANDVGALIERIEVLNKAVQMLGFKLPATSKSASKQTKSTAARKATVKAAAKKPVSAKAKTAAKPVMSKSKGASKPAAKKAPTRAASKPGAPGSVASGPKSKSTVKRPEASVKVDADVKNATSQN